MYAALIKLISEAMSTWGQTTRFCIIVAVVASTTIAIVSFT
ncbi:hypothetical protein OG742_23685 [Streptomyces sp. NBC_00828]